MTNEIEALIRADIELVASVLTASRAALAATEDTP